MLHVAVVRRLLSDSDATIRASVILSSLMSLMGKLIWWSKGLSRCHGGPPGAARAAAPLQTADSCS